MVRAASDPPEATEPGEPDAEVVAADLTELIKLFAAIAAELEEAVESNGDVDMLQSAANHALGVLQSSVILLPWYI